jgi:hypothetical protein
VALSDRPSIHTVSATDAATAIGEPSIEVIRAQPVRAAGQPRQRFGFVFDATSRPVLIAQGA